MPDVERPKIYVVCSDEARNGKTLLARLYTDYLIGIEREPFLLDLDSPDGDAANFFPDQSKVIDLARTQGQIAVFDTILSAPNRDYVIDLPARQLTRFFDIVDEISFIDEAHSAGLEFSAFFVVDRSLTSVSQARQLRDAHDMNRFIAVRNEFLGNIFAEDHVGDIYAEVASDGEIVITELDRSLMLSIEASNFSFSAYMAGRVRSPSLANNSQLRGFMNRMFGQFRDLQFRIDMFDLKKSGFI